MRYPNVLRGSRDLTFYVFRTTLIALHHIDAQWATRYYFGMFCFNFVIIFVMALQEKEGPFFYESKSGAKTSEKMQWKQ